MGGGRPGRCRGKRVREFRRGRRGTSLIGSSERLQESQKVDDRTEKRFSSIKRREGTRVDLFIRPYKTFLELWKFVVFATADFRLGGKE